MADDVTWWAPQSTEARGLARPVKGREQVIALLMTRGLFKPDGRTWSIHHLVAEGDVVAAHATMRAETVNGHPYENQYVFMFRIQQGRIAEVWEHLDTAHLYALLDS